MKRNRNNALIGGVCSGLADYVGTDPLVFRLLFVAAFLFFGCGVLLYFILWLLMD